MAASGAGLTPEQELHIQTAFLLAAAVDAQDPIAVLKEKIELHNLAEYHIVEAGPLKALLALSSDAVKFGPNTKSTLQVQPTVFVAFSNTIKTTGHDVPGAASLANVFGQQLPCGFPGAQTCNVHGHALKALEALPLGQVFSLLGQGYKLVSTGLKFGGCVAHLFATRVLLQLHSEVAAAKQMGIHLSVNMTEEKVASYAFGAPFFATSHLSRTLTQMEITPNNLHTFWRAGDAAPAFFTAASELFTVAAAARDASTDPAEAAAALATGFADDSFAPGNFCRVPQVTAVQDWCRSVSDHVDALSRCKGTGPSRLLTRPLEPALLGRLCGLNGLFGAPPPTEPLAGMGLDGRNGSGTGPRAGRRKSMTMDPAAVAAGMQGSFSAGAGAGPTGPRVGRRASLVVDPAQAAALGSAAPSPTAGRARRGSMLVDASGPSVSAGLGSGAPSPTTGMGRARRASLVMREREAAAAAKAAPSAAASVASTPKGKDTWKEALSKLLQVMGDGLGERYAPVGRFWVLGSVPAKEGGPKEAGPPLQSVEGSRAQQLGAHWLSPGSAFLFSRWEAGVEELEKDLMEAFPWSSFRPGVEIRGEVADRRALLRASAALDLAAMG
ncbi:hypothetical protein HYH03_001560 [Edaphochlamys debaryana]|uniref:Uncharacterized protein n=1 Tax=Edaphochlamys debaryana TaxID=47281 RepID=A0A835YGI6_9CHLO|nr:hypothetical protein HYH03_001560 [Edaphochlamys debaryana]|eukprot:KAG2500798.1 hypothetical protein HYH03_001560 [Edaphochlamys debaryana]